MKKILFFSCFIYLVLSSCDILRGSPFEVEGWTPGGGYHAELSSIEISLLLSHDCDRANVEAAFSVTEDGAVLKGRFLWRGKHLVFKPASPLEENRDYLISLGSGAEDRDGLSLERKFEAGFTTRPPGGRLKLLSINPGYDGNITENRESVELFFSEAVTVNSCVNSISFSPSLNGSWRLEENGKTARFTPFDPWKQGTMYKINAAADFKDSKGRSLGDDFTSFFSVAIGEENTKPELLAAWAVNPDTETELLNGEETGGWESFTTLRLDFSKPVDAGSVKARLSAEPNASLVMETPPGFTDSVSFRFAEPPVWNERYFFRLQRGISDKNGAESEAEKIFSVRTNGPLSRPPVLAGMRLPMAPGKTTDEQETLIFSPEDLFEDLPIEPGEDRYPYTEKVQTWIELYFDTAPETGIDVISLMDLFRVEATNGAISFSPRFITDSDFTLAEPEEKWASYTRIEIRGFLTNTVNSGVVSFLISRGLADSRGNKNQKEFRISLLK